MRHFMKRFFRALIVSLVVLLVACLPAIVAWRVEESRFRSFRNVAGSFEKIEKGRGKIINLLQELALTEDLEALKKDHEKFSKLRNVVETITESYVTQEEVLGDIFSDDAFIDRYLRQGTKTNVEFYLNLGFCLATALGIIFLYRLGARIEKKIATERQSAQALRRKQEDEMATREKELERKTAILQEQQRNPMKLTVDEQHAQKTRVRKQEARPTQQLLDQQPTPKPWSFFLVSNDSEKGRLMPQDRKEFFDAVKRFCKKNLVAIGGQKVYPRLLWVCQLDPALRAVKMDRIDGDGKFDGWYKLHRGSFRILLKFDDEQKELRFYLDNHDIYKKIRRS